MQTLKFKYSLDNPSDKDIILSYMKAYSACLHYMFNRVKDSSLNELSCRKLYQQGLINNIDILSSWFVQSSIREAIQICKSLESRDASTLVFGGKKLFVKRCQHKISRDEFLLKRLSPLYSIGVSGKTCLNKGNPKFHLSQDLSYIKFTQGRGPTNFIKLNLPKLRPNYKKLLSKLFILQERKAIPITYKLDLDYVYIIFDEEKLYQEYKQIKQKENRILGIDLNPNYIGWSIVDWIDESNYKVIKTGVYSLKSLNDKDNDLYGLGLNSSSKERHYISNKRKYELYEISKNLINIALKYQVGLVSVEDLSSLKPENHKKGKRLNKLINNQWNRTKIKINLEKRCKIYKIRFQKIQPQYSSFIGNILYRNLELPDPILSSIEIGRRGYEFLQQYINKTKDKTKNIIFPSMEKFNEAIFKSLEEFGVAESFKSWKEMFEWFKDSKVWYRVPFGDKYSKWFKFKSKKSNVGIFNLSH